MKRKDAVPATTRIVPNGVEIAALLPNPDGRDEGNEKVVIRNRTARLVDLKGWRLRDAAGNQFGLSGTVVALGNLEITPNAPSMPLNNDGDEVVLTDLTGAAVWRAPTPVASRPKNSAERCRWAVSSAGRGLSRLSTLLQLALLPDHDRARQEPAESHRTFHD